MKVRVEAIVSREVEIPNEDLEIIEGDIGLINDAYEKYLGEHSVLLKDGETCVTAIYDFEDNPIAEY